MQNPIILAHRGLAAISPENTLAAFRAAFDRRFGIETDLQLSADGEIVLIHDGTVARTTDGQGAVAEMTMAQLQGLDAGSWSDPRFRDERIPTLAQLLQLAGSIQHPTMLGLEIKAQGPAMVEQLCAAIAEYLLFDQVMGFGMIFEDIDFRRQIKSIDPRFPTSIRAEGADGWATAVAAEHADWIYTRFVPSRAQVRQAHHAGKRVLASAAPVMDHHPHNWLAARNAGVDALLTDYPQECWDVYRSSG